MNNSAKLEKIYEYEDMLGYDHTEMGKYQKFWGISDDDIIESWLKKLDMHINPIRPPNVIFDIQPWDAFVSPATGKAITSKAQRREDMKASGCRDWEGMDSELKVASRRKQEVEKKEDSATVEAVSKAWAQLEPEKKKVILDN